MGAGRGGFAKGRVIEYGQTDDFVKLDDKGRPIAGPGEKPKENKTITVYEDEDNDVAEDAAPAREGEVTIVATVAVPHLKKAVTQVCAYPYPMKPPTAKQKVRFLPDKDKPLKNMILSSGYFSRANSDVPYPPGGWRWQYAFQKAVKKSNLSMPHSIFEHYIWADRILPFVKEQAKAYNAFEKTRVAAYGVALQDFTDNRTEVEDQATQRGLTPVPMKRVTLRSGTIGMHYAGNVKEGKWWILATHRVPGLKYYWLLPKEIESKNHRIILNESNAIYIEGGW